MPLVRRSYGENMTVPGKATLLRPPATAFFPRCRARQSKVSKVVLKFNPLTLSLCPVNALLGSGRATVDLDCFMLGVRHQNLRSCTAACSLGSVGLPSVPRIHIPVSKQSSSSETWKYKIDI